MRNAFKLSISLFIFISCLLLTLFFSDNARAQLCDVNIIKVTRGEDIGFEFTATFGNDVDEFTLFDGSNQFVAFGPENDLVVTETVPPGWYIADIDCFNNGIAIVESGNGIVATCPGDFFRSAECVFVNVNPADIPTLSEWGMIAAAAGLGLVGVWFAIRKRKERAA
jgi:hypothetical protein